MVRLENMKPVDNCSPKRSFSETAMKPFGFPNDESGAEAFAVCVDRSCRCCSRLLNELEDFALVNELRVAN